jgi:signal transduction histidine kinase
MFLPVGEQSMPKKASLRPGFNWAAPGLVLALSVLGTAVATYSVSVASRARDEVRFRSAVRWTRDLINQRLDIYIAALRGAAAFFAAHPTHPTAGEFESFVQHLKLRENYPGIQGLGYAQRVPSADAAPVTAAMRSEGLPDFQIRPAGERLEYFPIVFLEPLDRRNREAIGYDMFSEPVRQGAMARARDEGIPVASGRVTLVQEIDPIKQPGFLIYLPIYQGGTIPQTVERRRTLLRGFLYSPFRADDLFAGIFSNEEQPRISFEVYASEDLSAEALLHRSALRPSAHSQFSVRNTFPVAGQPWTVLFQTTPAFEAGSDGFLVRWVLMTGILLTAALTLITGALASAQRQLKQAQTALQAHAQNLERMVAERTSRLQDTIRELEQMSYSITHDMRAPLRAIQGFGSMLEEDSGHCLTPDSRDYLNRMKIAAARMDTLIRDVLNYEKLVRDELPLQPTELVPLLRGIVTTYPAFQAPRAAIEVQPDVPPVLGNEAALTQCFSNLLSNAVKFSKTGQVPRVRIRASRDNGWVKVFVEDEGVGIHPDFQARIFGMFQRLDNSPEGTGIGLAIVRKAVERMGGRVGVSSREGQGSCFWVELKPA